MEYLWKIWYEDKQQAEALYQRYMADSDSVMLPFEISPFNCQREYALFYRTNNRMMLLLEEIYQSDRRLTEVASQLPEIAKEDFLHNLVVEELFTSNEIEHVESTRREIADSVKRAQKKTKESKVRFHSMAVSYLSLADGNVSSPKSLQDIRDYYDMVTAGEIMAENLPDGRYFRTEEEEVVTSTGRVIHRGVMPEARIEMWMQSLLQFMARNEFPALVRIAVAHYVFAYVHPFYDGNGRVGRYLSSLYLAQYCSKFTAYSLSQGCRMNQKRYYDMFDHTNRFNGYGEMNMFIEGFFTLVISGQEKIYNDLQARVSLLKEAFANIERDGRLSDDKMKRETMYVLEQKRLFDDYDEGFIRDDLEAVIKAHCPDMTHSGFLRMLKALEADGCVKCTKKRPMTYISAIEM